MKHVILAGALMGACGWGARAVAPPAAVSHERVLEPATVVGCLFPGSAAGEFIFSTGTERHTAIGDRGVDLTPHVHQRVRLTGALEERRLGPIFLVTAVSTVAMTCSAS